MPFLIPEPADEIDNTPMYDGDGEGYYILDDCRDELVLINSGINENCRTAYDDNYDGRVNEGCGCGSPIVRKLNVQIAVKR